MLSVYFQVFNEELFGNVAEEKLVAGIKSKVFEARSSKSYESYEIVATFIKQGTLSTLLKPLKEVRENQYNILFLYCFTYLSVLSPQSLITCDSVLPFSFCFIATLLNLPVILYCHIALHTSFIATLANFLYLCTAKLLYIPVFYFHTT